MNFTQAFRRLYELIIDRIGGNSKSARLFGEYIQTVLPQRETQYGLDKAPFQPDDAIKAFVLLTEQCGSSAHIERGLDAEQTLVQIRDKIVMIARTKRHLERKLSDADRTFTLFGVYLTFYMRLQIDHYAHQDPVIAALEAMRMFGLAVPSNN